MLVFIAIPLLGSCSVSVHVPPHFIACATYYSISNLLLGAAAHKNVIWITGVFTLVESCIMYYVNDSTPHSEEEEDDRYQHQLQISRLLDVLFVLHTLFKNYVVTGVCKNILNGA